MITNCLSVDVEDYYHPSEIQRTVPQSDWTRLPSRVEAATLQTLDQLAAHNVRGTFFILGWVAEHHPALVRRIAEAGHEVGCHSHLHRLVYELTPEQFRDDTACAVKAIEDACGQRPRAYRAPSFSVNKKSFWALEILVEQGFTHDSSIIPVEHDRYGMADFPRFPKLIDTPSGAILEIPVATVRLPGGHIVPTGGGGYLRMLPYRYTAAGIRQLNLVEGKPACLYYHPWEIDVGQPRIASGTISRLRTYMGLKGMMGKLDRLMREFSFSTLTAVYPLQAFR